MFNLNQLMSYFIIFLIFFEYSFGELISRISVYDVTMYVRLIYRVIMVSIIAIYLVHVYMKRFSNVKKILIYFLLIYLLISQFVTASVHHVVLVIPAMIIMIYSCFEFSHNSVRIGNSIRVILYLNVFLILLQFIGGIELVYFHQNFTLDLNANASFLQASGYLPNQQHRPHGIFPNTIYLSLFVIFYYSYLVLNTSESKPTYLLFGFLLPFIGSTTIIILLLSSLLFSIVNRNIIYIGVCSIFSFVFIYILFPLFFDMNYNLETYIISLQVRMDLNKSNNLFTSNLYTLYVVIVLLLFFSVYVGFKKVFIKNDSSLIFNAVVLFLLLSPLLIHPIFLDARYALLCGMVAGHLIVKEPANKSPT